MIHDLLSLFIVLCMIGLILWGVSQIAAIPPIVKTVVYVIIGVFILLWLLRHIGGLSLAGLY